jgi:hypothetical protein
VSELVSNVCQEVETGGDGDVGLRFLIAWSGGFCSLVGRDGGDCDSW